MAPPLNDYDSLDLCERVIDAGKATPQELDELRHRMTVAAELAEGLDESGALDDPPAELEAVRLGAAVAAGLKVGALRRSVNIEPNQAEALRQALKLHIEHLRTVRMMTRRLGSSS